MIKRVLIMAGIASLLAACGGSGNNANVTTSSTTLAGAGMKGPFAVGSTVKICQLDTRTAACTSASVSTTTTDKQGNFSAHLPWVGWSMIEITGKSFNEDSNATTTSDLSLRAITNITGTSDAPVVNLFTHWVAARITTLLNTSALANAYDTAHAELKAEMNLASSKTESLNLLVGNGANVADNALLLLFSGAFHKISGDSNVLAQLAEDFADNGKFDKYRHLNQMRYAAGEAGYLTKLRNNLVANDNTLSPPNANALADTNAIKGTIDPLASQQWHLAKINAAASDYPCALSENTCRGEGILVGVIDDGIEIAHEDLKDNIAYQKSRNYQITDTDNAAYYDPTPASTTHAHGTLVAGLIAAVDNNGTGVTGIAPRAQLAGLNILVNPTASKALDALGRKDIMVSNNSWGETDNTCIYQSEINIVATAIQNSVTTGRNGKGTVFLFASGNGGETCENHPSVKAIENNKTLTEAQKEQQLTTLIRTMLSANIISDQANLDALNNNTNILSIAALNNDDKKASYAERGSNTLIAAPAGNYCSATNPTLVTTDLSGERGANKTSATKDIPNQLNYSQCMNGTSGATPIVTGVVALMLQTNPNLTWRDVRMVLAKSAQKNDDQDTGWKTNTTGSNVHPYYGFGMVDAKAAVAMAKSWTNLPNQKSKRLSLDKGLTISSNAEADRLNTPVNTTVFDATTDTKPFSHIETIEVEIEFNGHQRVGDLQVDLVSTGTDSSKTYTETLVGVNGTETDSSASSFTFTLTSLHHLGSETPTKIDIHVYDKITNGKVGALTIKSLTLRGYDNTAVVATRSQQP